MSFLNQISFTTYSVLIIVQRSHIKMCMVFHSCVYVSFKISKEVVSVVKPRTSTTCKRTLVFWVVLGRVGLPEFASEGSSESESHVVVVDVAGLYLRCRLPESTSTDLSETSPPVLRSECPYPRWRHACPGPGGPSEGLGEGRRVESHKSGVSERSLTDGTGETSLVLQGTTGVPKSLRASAVTLP